MDRCKIVLIKPICELPALEDHDKNDLVFYEPKYGELHDYGSIAENIWEFFDYLADLKQASIAISKLEIAFQYAILANLGNSTDCTVPKILFALEEDIEQDWRLQQKIGKKANVARRYR